jgi:hypothetical protein
MAVNTSLLACCEYLDYEIPARLLDACELLVRPQRRRNSQKQPASNPAEGLADTPMIAMPLANRQFHSHRHSNKLLWPEEEHGEQDHH